MFVSIDRIGCSFVFSHDPENDVESFLGYELYYKLYDPSGETDSQTLFASDAAAIEAAAPGSVVAVLTGRGYRRIYPETESVPPLIPIDPGDKASLFTVTVSFPDKAYIIGLEPASAEWLSSGVTLLRDQSFAVIYGNETFFSDQISTDDPDVPDEAVDPTLDMGVVAISYGTDYENGTFAPVYSEPLVITDTENLLPIHYE